MRVLPALLVLAACGPAAAPDGGDATRTAAPFSWDSDGADVADRDCRVALQDVARPKESTGGYETTCEDGPCTWVWTGTVDVAADVIAAGGVPAVVYQQGSDPTWWRVPATPTDGAEAGFERFSFRMDEHLPHEDWSGTTLARADIQLIPVVELPDGARLFDHNENSGDFDNYHLTSANLFAIEAIDTCSDPVRGPVSTVVFDTGWAETQHGAVVQGGQLVVDYDLFRMPDCMGSSYAGYAAWDTLATVRFAPGGEQIEGSLRGCDDPQCQSFVSRPLEVDVPAGATSAEVWFFTSGRQCSSRYDSNLGDNYRLEVVSAAPPDVVWAGGWGHSTNRGCTRNDGVPDPLRVDSYLMERAACRYVDAQVYVPGVTEAGRAEQVIAQVEYRVDGGPPRHDWMVFDAKVGNDLRFRWNLPTDEMKYQPWSRYDYRFRFSTDGVVWHEIARDDGTDRVIVNALR